MSHYLIELAVWLLVAFFIGCLIGWLLRGLFGSKSADRSDTYARSEEPVRSAPAPLSSLLDPAPAEPVRYAPSELHEEPAVLAETAPPDIDDSAATSATPLPAVGRMERPRGLSGARDGKADNLQRISGIGPKNEKILHNLGVFHFDQIAAWTADQVAWVDDHLKFNGRITREHWIEQAQLLADGKDDEFRRQFGTGGLKNRSGVAESGTRTRKP